MRAQYLKALLVTGATTLAVGCGGAPQPPAQHRAATPASAPAATPFTLTAFQACQQLLSDLARNRGVPDIPTLRRIADHVIAPRLAADARTAVRDIDHTGVAPLAIGLLRDECARAGVRIPAS
jgi:hypothetical protein